METRVARSQGGHKATAGGSLPEGSDGDDEADVDEDEDNVGDDEGVDNNDDESGSQSDVDLDKITTPISGMLLSKLLACLTHQDHR